jgi:uncharacterized Zn finger protein
MRHAAGILDGIDASITSIYAARLKKPVEEMAKMLAGEVWLTAEQAKADGWADEIFNGPAPRAQLKLSGLANVPAAAMAAWGGTPTKTEAPMGIAAKLLAGQMPEYIEDTFEEEGLSLFPKDITDLETKCTCGGEGLCRHIIAVYYLLAEEFDRDPFLFMRLRGLDRDKLIQQIGSSIKRTKGKKAEYLQADLHTGPREVVQDMTVEAGYFWAGGSVNDERLGDVRIPPTPGALSKHLGHFPMWRGEERFLDALELVYKKASNNGMNVFLGDW